MRKFLSGVLASGLMLLTFPAMAAYATDAGDEEVAPAVAVAADPPVTEPAPDPEPATEPAPADEPKPVEKAQPDTVGRPSPPVDDKVWVDVCKYVGTPGDDERLKDGKNPIRVSYKAAEAPEVGAWFNDAHGRSYVVAVVDKDAPDTDRSACPAPDTFKPYLAHRDWLVPAEVGNPNGKKVDATFFPQPSLVGAIPCGRWAQKDTYGIDNKADEAILNSLGDLLEWVKGHPEDSAIYKTHVFVYGGDCPPPQPDPKVVTDYGDWVDGEWVCGDTTVEQTRKAWTITTPYKLVDGKWVLDPDNATRTDMPDETQTRDLTDDEQRKVCDMPKVPDPTVEYGEWGDGTPTCKKPSVTVERTVTTTYYGWEWVGFGGEYEGTVVDGWLRTEEFEVTTDTKTVRLDKGVDCSPDETDTLAFTGGGDSPLGPLGLAGLLTGILLLMASRARRA